MLSRRPSLQHAHDFISELDDAIARPAEDAPDSVRAAFAHQLEVARDTGDYSAVLKDGGQPSRITLRPIDPMVSRRLLDAHSAGDIGAAEMFAIVFCVAVEKVAGIDLPKPITDDQWGRRLPDSVLREFGDAVVNEVAIHAWHRALAISPKP